MKRLFVLFAVLLSCGTMAQQIDLSGMWRFSLDSKDVGISEKWFDMRLSDSIRLPGSTISEGKGLPVDISTPWTAGFPNREFFTGDNYSKYREKENFKVPFFLQPETYYLGAAWYQRDVEISRDIANRPLELFFERCHWQSTLWIDGKEYGKCDALGTPQRFFVSEGLSEGSHTLTVRMDNRVHDVDPGENAHSISDHTQGNWNGIVGQMHIKALGDVRIDSVRVTPYISKGTLKVEFSLYNYGRERKERVEYSLFGRTKCVDVRVGSGWNHLEQSFVIPENARLWDEFDPYLYDISIRAGETSRQDVFGLRELSVEDGILKINGKPCFMRGTLNCAQFPLTGYPAMDKAEWLREFSICRSYGLNHIRFHSWCPPKAAFEAADELGMYLYVECSAWAEIGTGKGINRYLFDESERMVYEYGNHPSFCFMSYGNEPGGKFEQILTDFAGHWKAKDSRRLYSVASGWPNLPSSDFLVDPAPRIQGWGQGLGSIINRESPKTSYDFSWFLEKTTSNQTFISHEIGQWCVYPRFDEISEYTGPYKARNFEIFKERLEESGLGHLADSFLMASGRLQTLCYKADIEAALRTKRQGGYELLGLQDFSGQGSALVGALDAFWNEKGYTSAREYRQFQNSIVPLARMEKMIYTAGEDFRAELELANFQRPLAGEDVSWRIADREGHCLKNGTFKQMNFSMGNCLEIGTVEFPTDNIVSPEVYSLTVEVAGHTNNWHFWVFPKAVIDTGDILLTDTLDESAMDKLKNGGKVLLSIRKGHLADSMGGDIKIGFSSIFWNTSWTNGQAPHTLGILCNPSDKALGAFPTDYHSDWQWWDAMSHSAALRLDKTGGRPIVRVIDDWFTARPLALITEGTFGGGKIIVSSVDFFDNMENRPEGRQLLVSLLQYMKSADFNPAEKISLP